MYRIEFEDGHKLFHLTVEGYWTIDDFKAFEADAVPTVEKLVRRWGSFRYLSDARRYPVQSPEVGLAFKGYGDWVGKANKGPVALIAGSVLNKLQAERVFQAPRVRIFMDLTDARKWLLEWPLP